MDPKAPVTTDDLPTRRLRATRHGEWPNGIQWTPGEGRTLPAGYPVPPGDPWPPAWLLPDADDDDAPEAGP